MYGRLWLKYTTFFLLLIIILTNYFHEHILVPTYCNWCNNYNCDSDKCLSKKKKNKIFVHAEIMFIDI